MNIYFMLSAVPSRKENKDILGTCQGLILGMKYTNIEKNKEALFLFQRIQVYLFISLKKEYTMRSRVVEIHFLEKKNKSHYDFCDFVKIKIA